MPRETVGTDCWTGTWPPGSGLVVSRGAVRSAVQSLQPATRATLFLGHQASPGETRALGPSDPVIPLPTTVTPMAGAHTSHQGLCPPPEARPDPHRGPPSPGLMTLCSRARTFSRIRFGRSGNQRRTGRQAAPQSRWAAQARALSSGSAPPASAAYPAGARAGTPWGTLRPMGEGHQRQILPNPHQGTMKK